MTFRAAMRQNRFFANTNAKTNILFSVYFVLIFLINGIVSASVDNSLLLDIIKRDPDFSAPTDILITNKGFPVETHSVETPDNYVLTIHRIPNGNGYQGDETQRPIMFLQHGLGGASSDWVLNFANSSYAFILFQKGFDVWLGNYRGNSYSKTNTIISNRSPDFWKFSWDEMGLIDLPTMIDYVLQNTSQSKLYYTGHSMGTTTMFALLADKPEYQQKVIAAAMMCPVATISHSTSPIFYAYPLKDLVHEATGIFGVKGEILSNTEQYRSIIKLFCSDSLATEMCSLLVSYSLGEGPYCNKTRVAVYLTHFPAGTSTFTLIHYGQQKFALDFQKYDYGFFENYQKYNQFHPPTYDIRQIKTPIGLFSSTGDALSNQKDIDYLRKRLHVVGEDYIIKDSLFTHLDFIVAITSQKMLYPVVESFFKKFPWEPESGKT